MNEKRTPKYRRQRNKYRDLAFVELGGKKYYLGKYDSPESRQRYHQILAEWTVNGYQPQ